MAGSRARTVRLGSVSVWRPRAYANRPSGLITSDSTSCTSATAVHTLPTMSSSVRRWSTHAALPTSGVSSPNSAARAAGTAATAKSAAAASAIPAPRRVLDGILAPVLGCARDPRRDAAAPSAGRRPGGRCRLVGEDHRLDPVADAELREDRPTWVLAVASPTTGARPLGVAEPAPEARAPRLPGVSRRAGGRAAVGRSGCRANSSISRLVTDGERRASPAATTRTAATRSRARRPSGGSRWRPPARRRRRTRRGRTW